MPTMHVSRWLVAASLSLLPALAAGAEAAPIAGNRAPIAGDGRPTPEDREIPRDRGRLFLLEKDLQRELKRLEDPGTGIEKRVEIIGVFALTRERRAAPLLVTLVQEKKEDMALKTAALWALGEIGDLRGMAAFQFALNAIYNKDTEWSAGKAISFEVEGGEKTISLREMCEAQLAKLAEATFEDKQGRLQSAISAYASLLSARIKDNITEPLATPNLPTESAEAGKLRAALITLAAVGDRDSRAVKAVIDVLKADDKFFPWDFKVIAAEALSSLIRQRAEQFKELKTKDTLADDVFRAFIEGAVVTDVPEVREIAGGLFRKMGWADRAARSIVTVLQQPNLPKTMCYRAVEALAFIQSKEAADQLMFMLFDPDRNIRWRAAVALGATGDRRATKLLCKLTKDQDFYVREKAIAALGHMEDPAALPDLAVAMGDPDYRVRRQAAVALGRLGRRQAIPVLVNQGLKDSSPWVRGMSIVALGYVGRTDGVKHIPDMLADKDAGVRLVAVQVLERFLNPGATRALVAALGDADKAVREAAVKAVGERIQRTPKETLDLLTQATANSKGDARSAAVQCIATDYRAALVAKDTKRRDLYEQLLAKASEPLPTALIAALGDAKAETRAAAGKLLADHGWAHKNKDLIAPVAALATDPDPKVRTVGLLARNYLNNPR